MFILDEIRLKFFNSQLNFLPDYYHFKLKISASSLMENDPNLVWLSQHDGDPEASVFKQDPSIMAAGVNQSQLNAAHPP